MSNLPIHDAQLALDNATLLDKVARLEAWVSDLQSGMYVNCVYCGHRYGPGETTPVSMADALKAHIETCPQHPMSDLKKQVAHDAAWMKVATEAFKDIDAYLLSEFPDLKSPYGMPVDGIRRAVTHIKQAAEARALPAGTVAVCSAHRHYLCRDADGRDEGAACLAVAGQCPIRSAGVAS